MESVINIKNRPLSVEIADDDDKRMTGLMFRHNLPWESGMLFVHEAPQHVNYHMKNTNIPLSIAFVRETGQIAEIRHMTPRSKKTTSSTEPVKYALEVNRGWFEENKVLPGDYILGLPL